MVLKICPKYDTAKVNKNTWEGGMPNDRDEVKDESRGTTTEVEIRENFLTGHKFTNLLKSLSL